MSDVLLQVSDLVKRYPGNPAVHAVECVSFGLHRGEILGLLGPNGAGKTTTIRMLLSTLTPTSGSIHYFGMNFFQNRSESLQRVGFASTYTNLPLFLTVAENLDIHGRLYGMSRNDRLDRAKKLLDFFGVYALKSRRITQLSAGQRTRIMLAKAFLPRPDIALLDEPTASLDPEISHEVRAFVSEQRRREGVSILFSSHNMDEVALLCDRVVFLRRGQVMAVDSPQNLAASVARSVIELDITGGKERLAAILQRRELSSEERAKSTRISVAEASAAELIRELVIDGVTFDRISIEKASLEDYFLKSAQDENAPR